MPSFANRIPQDRANANRPHRQLAAIDLSVATRATRLALRGVLEVMIFESAPPAGGRRSRRGRGGRRARGTAAAYNARSARLQVFRAFHRWFAAWHLPPEETAGLPPEQAIQLVTVHSDPASKWGVILHEV